MSLAKNMIVSKYIPNVAFYIPLLYVKFSRLGESLSKSVSLFLIYVVPTFFAYFLYSPISFSVIDIIIYTMGLVSIYSVYEMGYIQNDTETIKDEDRPTIRLYDYNFEFYENNKRSIYLTRLIISLVLCLLIVLLKGVDNVGGWTFILAIIAICCVYQIYNRIRSRSNLLLFAILSTFRYLSYLLLWLPIVNPKIAIVLFISFPVCNIIEIGSKNRYNLFFLQNLIPAKNFDLFRMRYYIVLSLCSAILIYLGVYTIYENLIIYYFMIYRLSIYLISKKTLNDE